MKFEDRGTLSLNGPHITGYGTKIVVGGVEILIIAADKEVGAGVAAYLDDRPSQTFEVVLGQKPWYQLEDKGFTLQDALEPERKERRTLDQFRRIGLLNGAEE